MMTTWREELAFAMSERGEANEQFECTLTPAELDERFDPSCGVINGKPFTAWTEKSVYFPICYDGSEWVGSVSRHPDGKPTNHQGG